MRNISNNSQVLAAAGPTFIPSSVSAQVGDKVVFEFSSGNHSITQSTFDKPCDKLSNGFDSDYTGNTATEISLAVNVSTAQFFYSKQSSDCQEGMVFALNPTTTQSESAFRALAIAQTNSSASGMTTGAKAGAAIGSIAGVGFLGLLALLFLRRRKQHQKATDREKYGEYSQRDAPSSPTTLGGTTQDGHSGFRNGVTPIDTTSNNAASLYAARQAEGRPSVPPKGGELHAISSPTELAAWNVVEMPGDEGRHYAATANEKSELDSVRELSPTHSVGTFGAGYVPGNDLANIMSPESNHARDTWGGGRDTNVSSPEDGTIQNLYSPNDRAPKYESHQPNGWR